MGMEALRQRTYLPCRMHPLHVHPLTAHGAYRKDLVAGTLPAQSSQQAAGSSRQQQLKQAGKQPAAAISSAHTQAAPCTADTATQTTPTPTPTPELIELNRARSTPQPEAELTQPEPATPRRSTRSMSRKEASPLAGGAEATSPAQGGAASPARGVRGVPRRSSSLSRRKPPASPSRSQSSMQGDKQSTPPLPSRLSDTAEQAPKPAPEAAVAKTDKVDNMEIDTATEGQVQQPATSASRSAPPEQRKPAAAPGNRHLAASTDRQQGKPKAGPKALQGKAVLAEAWREDSDPGQAVTVLRDLFGELALPHFWGGRLANVVL